MNPYEAVSIRRDLRDPTAPGATPLGDFWAQAPGLGAVCILSTRVLRCKRLAARVRGGFEPRLVTQSIVGTLEIERGERGASTPAKAE